jgi:hypothetical protein
VRFPRSRQDQFEELRAAVEQGIAAFHSGQRQQTATSSTDELYKLGQMAQQGLLSPAEFQAAKARLLGL